MKCNFCDKDAVFAPVKNDIRVGLCSKHLTEYGLERRNINIDEFKEILKKEDVNRDKINEIFDN